MHRPRILLVEDDDSMRFALSRCFVLRGWEVLAAENLGEAYQFLPTRNGTFDAALVDLCLPDGSGESLIADMVKIRSSPKIIAYTACGERRRIDKALSVGVHAVILKPAGFLDTIFPIIAGTYDRSHVDPDRAIFPEPSPN